MNIHQLSELVLKVAAILCFTYVLSHLGYYFSFFFIEDIPPVDLIITNAIGPTIGPIVVGIFLLAKAKKWGGRLVANKSDTEEVSLREWHAIFLSLMGLFIVVKTIVPFVNQVFAILQFQNDSMAKELPTSFIAWLVGYSITLFIGLWLFLGSRAIVGAIRKLRYAGT
jgi:DMSO/TMAO reductase YedYZ heme-binding membrane subunit